MSDVAAPSVQGPQIDVRHEAYRSADLVEENRQLRIALGAATPMVVQTASSNVPLFVGGVIGLSALAVIAILAIFVVRPDKDNTALITTVVGVLVPSVSALMAAAVQNLHSAVDGRLTQLLALTARASKAEGILKEKERTV